jgi:hypothetical protein
LADEHLKEVRTGPFSPDAIPGEVVVVIALD